MNMEQNNDFKTRVQRFYNSLDSDMQKDFAAICPELTESEDERIRKNCLHFLELQKGHHASTIEIDECMAWLEKQGEKNPITFNNAHIIDSALNDYCCEQYHALHKENGGVLSFARLQHLAMDIYGWCEKQILANSAKTCKDEQKFHIEKGKWYVCIQSFTLNGNIVVEKGRTYKSREDNAISGEDTRLFIDKHDGDAPKYFKPWTIQDAKDGDVLYTPKGCGVEGIFLIGGWKQVKDTGRTLCSDIGYRVEDDEIIAGGLGAIWWEGVIDPFYPATKEQRDTLFAKMHEAGYEWDAEKKELNKIEQKPAWSEEDEERLDSIIESYKFLLRDYKACHDVDYIPYNSNTVMRTVENDVNFLKSLKERFTWKPSEEQLRDLKIIAEQNAANMLGNNLVNLYNKLKKL